MRSLFLVMFVFLAACSSGQRYTNPLSADVRDSLYIKTIDVVWAENAKKPESELSADEQLKRTELAAAIKESVGAAFKVSPAGLEASRILVTLTEGGTAMARGRADIIRIRDSATVASYNVGANVQRSGFLSLVQGKGSKIAQVANTFAYDLSGKFFGR